LEGAEAPLKKPQEMADYVFFPTKKNKSPNLKSAVHWYFYVPVNSAAHR
jgi:hypothetical protein